VKWIPLNQDKENGPCECGYEPSGSIKGRELTDNSATVSFSRKSPA
jgi:hypothetical protein